MNKETIKRIVLGLLVILLIYIWWDAIAVFTPTSGETPGQINQFPTGSRTGETSETIGIEYQTPKTNPFARVAKTKPTQKPAQNVSLTIAPTLSLTHQLTGILREGQLSQAVIKLPSGNSAILSLGDTLSDWRLHTIDRELVVFKQDKRFDTLFLDKLQK